jgi:hypothetical protein
MIAIKDPIKHGSKWEKKFAQQWAKLCYQTPLGEFDSVLLRDVVPIKLLDDPKLDPDHRFDFFWNTGLIVELNGSTHQGKAGGHSSGMGINRDYFKLLACASVGFQLIYLDGEMVLDDQLYPVYERMAQDKPYTESDPLPPIFTFNAYQRNKKKNGQRKLMADILILGLTDGTLSVEKPLGNIASMVTYFGKNRPDKRKRAPKSTAVSSFLRDIGCGPRQHKGKATWFFPELTNAELITKISQEF